MKAIAQHQKTTTSTTAKPQAAVPVQTPEVERPDIATQLAGAALFGHHLGAVNVQSRSPLIVQPQLTVGPVNDKYEQEADRVARQVVAMPAPVQRPNTTGLSDTLKTGIENLSGYSLDDVKVHYNSVKPAQLNALAYAQGREIYIAPGQEQHLPHEAWHVVQQAQRRVKPTMQMKDGVPINNDVGLEHEADVMGAKALAKQRWGHRAESDPTSATQGKFAPVQCTESSLPIQMRTARTVPEFVPGAIPAYVPPIYTSTNFDNNHVVAGPTKEKARQKYVERGKPRSTIVAPGPLNTAMEKMKRELLNSAATDVIVELDVPVDWNNAIIADKSNTCKVDEIKVKTRFNDGVNEVYHLDESSINLTLGDVNEFPPLPDKKL